MDNPFEKMIPWHLLEQHLRESIDQDRAKSDTLEGTELYRNQGRVQKLKELLNLPGTLYVKFTKEE